MQLNTSDRELITRVKEGMDVYDADGKHVGTVKEVTTPDSVSDGPVDGESIDAAQRDLSVGGFASPTARMRQTGHLRIDADGWFSRDIYIGTEHLDDVSEDRITLTVAKHVI